MGGAVVGGGAQVGGGRAADGAKAARDPDGLLADLAALYPELDAGALTEQLARVLFVADVWGQLMADE